jgi:hypothetical protein
VISFTILPLYPRGNSHPLPLYRRLGVLHSLCERHEEEKYILSLDEIATENMNARLPYVEADYRQLYVQMSKHQYLGGYFYRVIQNFAEKFVNLLC